MYIQVFIGYIICYIICYIIRDCIFIFKQINFNMDPNTLWQNFPDHWDKANAIRMLSVDAVEQANSGHPGMPMGMADVATVLFEKHLKFLSPRRGIRKILAASE